MDFDAYLMSGVRRLVYGLIGRDADMPGYYDYVRRVKDDYRYTRRAAVKSADDIVNELVRELRGE